ncbi:MAG: hypothetical protein ABIS07_17290, partial [Dokdonella sp.]
MRSRWEWCPRRDRARRAIARFLRLRAVVFIVEIGRRIGAARRIGGIVGRAILAAATAATAATATRAQFIAWCISLRLVFNRRTCLNDDINRFGHWRRSHTGRWYCRLSCRFGCRHVDARLWIRTRLSALAQVGYSRLLATVATRAAFVTATAATLLLLLLLILSATLTPWTTITPNVALALRCGRTILARTLLLPLSVGGCLRRTCALRAAWRLLRACGLRRFDGGWLHRSRAIAAEP